MERAAQVGARIAKENADPVTLRGGIVDDTAKGSISWETQPSARLIRKCHICKLLTALHTGIQAHLICQQRRLLC